MAPLTLDQPVRSRYLSIGEREQILAGMVAGWSIRRIAASIGRHPSTVMREMKRNLNHQQYRSRRSYRGMVGRPRRNDWNYSPHRAQRRADAQVARPKVAKLAVNARLREEVQNRLTDKFSPEQVSNRLVLDFPDEPEMRVSHEAIYQALYVQGRGALRSELTACLRTGRAIRRPRRRHGERRGRIPGMVNIADRPAEVDDRAIPGHWEGDLIIGVGSKSAIGTLVERVTGFVQLLHLPERHSALEVENAMIAKAAQLPYTLKKTLTWDQGVEMSNHLRIAKATGIDIYFCDPHSPWQRGTNENTNGLLRQYFPKSSDLSIYPADYLDYVAMQLNNRPRKRHQWRTPAEKLDQLLSNPPDHGVALTP